MSAVTLRDCEFNLRQTLLSYSTFEVQAFSLVFFGQENIKLKHFMWWKVSSTNSSHAKNKVALASKTLSQSTVYGLLLLSVVCSLPGPQVEFRLKILAHWVGNLAKPQTNMSKRQQQQQRTTELANCVVSCKRVFLFFLSFCK